MTVLLPKLNSDDPKDIGRWARALIAALEQEAPEEIPAILTAPINTLAVAPTTTQLPPGQWALFKLTGAGTVELAYNDAGTIKKVVLT